jgi:hypothetical protein
MEERRQSLERGFYEVSSCLVTVLRLPLNHTEHCIECGIAITPLAPVMKLGLSKSNLSSLWNT